MNYPVSGVHRLDQYDAARRWQQGGGWKNCYYLSTQRSTLSFKQTAVLRMRALAGVLKD